jgi:hypothetical protein
MGVGLRVEARAIFERASSICHGVGCEDGVGGPEMANPTEPAVGVGVVDFEGSVVKSKLKPSCCGASPKERMYVCLGRA